MSSSPTTNAWWGSTNGRKHGKVNGSTSLLTRCAWFFMNIWWLGSQFVLKEVLTSLVG